MDATQLLLLVPVLLFSFVAHEYAHGYAALRQGDPTAYQLGRLTFNPLKHIDPVMTVIVPAVMLYTSGTFFGGAKPVPVETRNFRHFKRGDIIVSLAGVATNFALAPVCALLAVLLGVLGQRLPAVAPSLAILQIMMLNGVAVNLSLGIFNLLPLPPLDGSHVFKYLLPPAWSLQYQQLGRFGFLLLFAMISFLPSVLRTWMAPARVGMGVAEALIAPFLLPNPLG